MDIDIDLQTAFVPERTFIDWVRAAQIQNGQYKKHNVGMYPQGMAKDPITGFAAIPYKEAEDLGYMKLDFLPVHVYDFFQSREEIEQLIELEPNWELLRSPSIVEKLFHIGNHFDIIDKVQPRSIQELADCLALIRPGKRNLLDHYIRDREKTRPLLYFTDERFEDSYSFKRAHSISYAMIIVLQLHIIGFQVS